MQQCVQFARRKRIIDGNYRAVNQEVKLHSIETTERDGKIADYYAIVILTAKNNDVFMVFSVVGCVIFLRLHEYVTI